MNQADAAKAIQQRWMTLWPGLTGSVPFVFDDDAIDQYATYARVRVQFLEEVQQTLGQPPNRKFVTPGLINVDLFTPGNQGRNYADVLTKAVRDVVQSVRFGLAGGEEGVVTYATSSDKDPRSDMQYFIMSTSTPFEFFDVR